MINLITEEDILKIQSELTEEQFQKYKYYLSKDKFIELKEMARKKCKTKFVLVMRRYINKFLNDLKNKEDFKRSETINLLNQTRKTLKNIYKLIDRKEVVDANSLLRSAFENLIMGMMIYENDDTYKEFINLSIDDTTRKYTKPQKLRNDFRKVLRKLDGDLFSEISNRNLKNLLDDFYNKMCLYTHSTLVVNAMIEIENDDMLDLYVLNLKWNTYFIEFLLYLCLKELCDYKKEPINFDYIVIGFYIMASDISKEQILPEKTEILNNLLHYDYNKEYLNKKDDDISFLINQSKEIQDFIQNNPMEIISFLTILFK